MPPVSTEHLFALLHCKKIKEISPFHKEILVITDLNLLHKIPEHLQFLKGLQNERYL